MKKIQLNNCSYVVCKNIDELKERISKVDKNKYLMLKLRPDGQGIIITEQNIFQDTCNQRKKNISKIEFSNFQITNQVIDLDKLLNSDYGHTQASQLGMIFLKNPNNQKYYILENKKIDVEKELTNLFKIFNDSRIKL